MARFLARISCSWVLLLVSSTAATAAAAAGSPSTDVAKLQQEVQEMKQQLSVALGAEPVEQMLGESLTVKHYKPVHSVLIPA
jgi:hypothetical protein